MTKRIRAGRIVAAGMPVALLSLAIGVAPGVAAPPRDHATITSPPVIAKEAAVGDTLTATGAKWETNRPPVVTYRWVRCADEHSFDCELTGATGPSYKVTADDLGQHLVVWLHVQSGNDGADAISEMTDAVTKPVPPPPPAPSPSPSPAPAPSPSPAPAPAAVKPAPAADLVPPDVTTPAVAKTLKRLSPFPIVRIKGYLTRTGARVTMLTVRAPRGAKIRVRCTGAGCPRKHFARSTKLVHLRPYQRLLRGNVKLVISVTRRGFVGKQTTIRLRRGKAPTRRDLCLFPGVRKAKSCSAAA